MKAAEVRKLSLEEINITLAELRRQLYDIRSQAVTEKLEDPSQIAKKRKDIARLLTEKHSRESAS